MSVFDPLRTLAKVAKLRPMNEAVIYKADPWTVTFLAAVFAGPALVMILSLLLHPSRDAAVALGVLMLLPIGAIAYAASFRVTFTADMFFYRQWGRNFSAPLNDIMEVKLVWPNPLFRMKTWALIRTRDGNRCAVWVKLFPAELERRLMALVAENSRA